MSLASATTMALSLMVVAIFLILARNMEHLATAVEKQVEIKAYVAEGTSPAAVAALKEGLAQLPGVAKVKFVSREEALVQLKVQFGDKRGLLEGVEEQNALRDSFLIQAARPELVDAVVERVRGMAGVAEVIFKRDLVHRIFRTTGLLRLAALSLATVLGLAMALIVSNTIRLTIIARGTEIGIMKLVGATDAFVRRPFVLEGVLLGLVAAAIAGAAVAVGYAQLASGLLTLMPFLPLLPVNPLVWQTCAVVAALGVFIGAVGSSISVRRYLRI
jgi:cell division transport system permease protein